MATRLSDLGGLTKRRYADKKNEPPYIPSGVSPKMPRRKVKRMIADKKDGKKSAGFGRMLKSRSRGPADSDRDDYKSYA